MSQTDPKELGTDDDPCGCGHKQSQNPQMWDSPRFCDLRKSSTVLLEEACEVSAQYFEVLYHLSAVHAP